MGRRVGADGGEGESEAGHCYNHLRGWEVGHKGSERGVNRHPEQFEETSEGEDRNSGRRGCWQNDHPGVMKL